MQPKESISLLMPTLNRHDFVVRSLNYYSSVGFKGYICIGDSSNAEAVEKTKRAIEPLQNQLNIIYRSCPAPPHTQDKDPLATPGEGICIKELIELAPTKYAALAPDDDFQIPNGMTKCVEFLESHEEYSAAHGSRIDFQLSSGGAHGSFASAYYVRQPVLEGPSASQRWSAYMRHAISPAYSVLRTESMRRIFKDLDVALMRFIGSELIPSGMTPILGKVKELDCLTTMHHDNEVRVWGWDTQSMYSMLMHPAWSQSVKGLRESICTALSEADRIDRSEAEAIFDREFWNQTMTLLRHQFKKTYGTDMQSERTGLEEAFFKAASSVPFARSLARRLRTRIEGNTLARGYENSTSVESLLKPSSPFHADFMPVYRVIVNGPTVR